MKAVEINLDKKTICKLTILMNSNLISGDDFIKIIWDRWSEYCEYYYGENDGRMITYTDPYEELDQMIGMEENNIIDYLDDLPF